MKDRFETFTSLIVKITRSIRKIKTEEMSEFDLRSTHAFCLYYIYKEKSVTPKELALRCGEDKAAVSRALDYLETCEYLTRSSEDKKYKKPIRLTEKGKSAGVKIAEKLDRILEQAGRGMSEEERLIFYKNLKLVCENLEKICSEYE